MENNPAIIEEAANQDLVKKVLKDLQSGLSKMYGVEAPSLLVYGSYARGESHAGSDLDLVLIYPNNIQPGRESYRVSEILAELNLRYQVLISVLPVSRADYRRAQGPFWNNVRREAKTIRAI